MSRTFHNGDRRIRVLGIRRERPDLQKLARALIELAQAQIEVDAETDHQSQTAAPKTPKVKRPPRPKRKPS